MSVYVSVLGGYWYEPSIIYIGQSDRQTNFMIIIKFVFLTVHYVMRKYFISININLIQFYDFLDATFFFSVLRIE